MNEHEEEQPLHSDDAEPVTELDRVIAEFLQLRDAGERVERDAFAARHFGLREELLQFFKTLDAFEGVREVIDQSPRP